MFSVFSCFSSVASVLEFLAPCVGTHNQLFESRAFSEQTRRGQRTRKTRFPNWLAKMESVTSVFVLVQIVKSSNR